MVTFTRDLNFKLNSAYCGTISQRQQNLKALVPCTQKELCNSCLLLYSRNLLIYTQRYKVHKEVNP